ncbi:MAG: tetratricopeptide repeat protein [Bacteroidota bacterium]|nr:tetratricopeptide repeat protein [Bacteroidota bacterium]
MRLNILSAFLFLFLFGVCANAQKTSVDSTINQLNKLPDDTATVRKINEFIWDNKFSGIQKNIIQLGINNIERAEQLKDLVGAGTSAKNTAAIYYYGGDYAVAEEYYQKSLSLYEKADYFKGIADANRNIGNIYSQKGNWKQALDNFFKSLAKYEEINDSSGISGTLDAIGITYKTSGEDNYKKALEYFRKAVKVKRAQNNEKALISSYLYIGDTYLTESQGDANTQSSDSSLIYFRKAQKLSLKYNTPQFYGMINDAFGIIFLEKNEYDSAYRYFKKSLRIKEKAGNAFGIASTKHYLGQYYNLTNKKDSSLKYYTEAYEIAGKIHADKIEHDISKEMAEIYFKKDNFKQSAQLFKKYIILHDSLQNKENTKRITQLEMQYEFDKKEKLQEAEIKRQKIITSFFIVGFLLMILMALIVFRSYKNKQKANKLLEQKNNVILSKNAILNQQKEEIETQRDEIEEQRDHVIEQRDKIAKQNKDITDSIVYAQRIQQAVLPPENYIDDLLPEYFILFKPRDIVSGDYYWTNRKNGKVIITAADCTGHGVPGAFMSLLGISFLNDIVNQLSDDEIKPNIILNKLRTKIKKSLRQTGEFNKSKDGMDMALCVIDSETNKMEYAGAHNPLILVRDNEIIHYKADRMPVGIHFRNEKPFSKTTLDIQKGDKFYIFSDGYVDQFGGEKGRKFMMKRFKKLILDSHNKPMNEQKVIFDTTIENWKGQKDNTDIEIQEQLDDILIISFKY